MTVSVLLGACAGQSEKPFQYSGFLSAANYDRLTKIDTPSNQILFRYVDPGFIAADYHHVIVDPVLAYPEPRATKNVSKQTLVTLQLKLTRIIEDSFASVLPLAKTPGEGIIRIQTAIAGVNVSTKSLQPREYIPIALIAAGVNTARGGRDQEVKLYLEGRLVDSATNRVMAIGIRQINGEDLENANAMLQAQQLNKGFKAAGNDFVTTLKRLFSN